jgi:hypothetical protein
MKFQNANPERAAYPKVGKNSTLGGESNQGRSVKAQNGLKNVNAKQGPRIGNAGDLEKRRTFVSNKKEAAPLATIINNAYAARKERDYIDPKQAGIEPDVKPRKRSR